MGDHPLKNECQFRIPESPGIYNAPLNSDECIPSEWIRCETYSLYEDINWCDVHIAGRGGYGDTYFYKDKIIKIIESRKDDHTTYSEQWYWKRMRDFPDENRYSTEDENREAFIEDVMWEAWIQDHVSKHITTTDGHATITPRVYASGVYVDRGGFYVGVIIMERIYGVGLTKLFDRRTKHPIQPYVTKTYIESILYQLRSFSEQMIALGYIHNDTAGDNIQIEDAESRSPIVRILDWGMAVPLELEKYSVSEKSWHKLPDIITKRTINELASNLNDEKRGSKKRSRKRNRLSRKGRGKKKDRKVFFGDGLFTKDRKI